MERISDFIIKGMKYLKLWLKQMFCHHDYKTVASCQFLDISHRLVRYYVRKVCSKCGKETEETKMIGRWF